MAYQIVPQPFEQFVESVASARYADFRYRPGTEVESEEAFDEMRAHVLGRYAGIRSRSSVVEADGQVVDCFPDDGVALTPPDARPAPDSRAQGVPHDDPFDRREVAVPPPQSEARAKVGRAYPEGTTPMPRVTLEQLTRFKNLAAFFTKDDVFAAAGATSAGNKRYATGEQDVHCLGGEAWVNVWKPFPAPVPLYQATFSQQWYIAGHGGTLVQTVECGWHVDVHRYGDMEPHLFVFATRNNYCSNDSVYNTDNGVYRPATNPYVLPGAALPYSQFNGTQITYPMAFYLTAGAWWFYFDGIPVGCFPLEWFQNGPIVNGATRIRFGGEVGSGISTWPPMGSGSHASAGWTQAAYQRSAIFYPTSGGAPAASLSEAGSVVGRCYTVDIANNSSSDWGTYLYFGGPGGLGC